MIERSFEPSFTLALAAKDAGLVADAAAGPPAAGARSATRWARPSRPATARRTWRRRSGLMARALLIIDFQNDFTPGGALAVTDGDAIAARINALAASGDYDLVVATRDWHPADHLVRRPGRDLARPLRRRARRARELHPALDRTQIDVDRRQGPGRRHRRLQRLRGHRSRGAPARARHHAGHRRRARDRLLRQEHRARRAARGLRGHGRHHRGPRRRGPAGRLRARAGRGARGGGVWREARRRDRLLASCARTITDERVLEAMRAVPRDRFVPAELAARGVGQRPAADRRRADDLPAAGRRPHVRAARAARRRADPRRRHRLGLPRRAARPARRARVERRAPRAPCPSRRRATSRRRVDNVTLVVGDGARGLPETAPFDAINVAAAAGARSPPALRRRSSAAAGGSSRRSTTATSAWSSHRTPARARAHGLERVRFVPLVDLADAAPRRGFGRYSRPTFAHGLPSSITTSAVKSFEPRISDEPTP